MLFALLPMFTEDNTEKLTRQSMCWGASALFWEGLSVQYQTSSLCHPQLPQAPAGRMPWTDCLGSIQHPVKSRRILTIDSAQSLPPGTQGESSYCSFLSLNTPLGANLWGGGEEASPKLSILHPEMGKRSVVLVQGISCYNFFFTLPVANRGIKESWFFFFPLPSMRCSLLQTVGTQSPKCIWILRRITYRLLKFGHPF